eukprot:48050-Amphidinium_carterae.1
MKVDSHFVKCSLQTLSDTLQLLHANLGSWLPCHGGPAILASQGFRTPRSLVTKETDSGASPLIPPIINRSTISKHNRLNMLRIRE